MSASSHGGRDFGARNCEPERKSLHDDSASAAPIADLRFPSRMIEILRASCVTAYPTMSDTNIFDELLVRHEQKRDGHFANDYLY